MRSYFVLLALCLLYINNQWARGLPSYLVRFDKLPTSANLARELINVDLGFNEEQYGLLVSFGFTVLYVACSFPAGAACNLYSRKLLLLASAACWSVATAGSAFARSFSQLLVARVLLGVAQAFSGPAAHTLIAATFPPSRRATAHSIYTSGVYVGAALASLSVLVARLLGWRGAALLVAISALPPMALLAIMLREAPAAKSADAVVAPASAAPAAAPGPPSLGAALRAVLSVGSVRWLLAGTTARLFAGFAIGAWSAPYYRATFPQHASTFALMNALIVAGGGTLAVVCGGLAADRATDGGRRPERAAYIPMVGALLAIPGWLLAVRSPHFGLAMAGLLGAFLCAEAWFGATISMLQQAVPQRISGTAQGLLNFVQLFSSFSPPLIGALHRRGVPLRLLLSLCVPGSYVITAVCFWRAAQARAAEARRAQ